MIQCVCTQKHLLPFKRSHTFHVHPSRCPCTAVIQTSKNVKRKTLWCAFQRENGVKQTPMKALRSVHVIDSLFSQKSALNLFLSPIESERENLSESCKSAECYNWKACGRFSSSIGAVAKFYVKFNFNGIAFFMPDMSKRIGPWTIFASPNAFILNTRCPRCAEKPFCKRPV